jgi:hypothetical protein
MKKLVTLLLSFVVALALVLPAEAVEDGQVMYFGGTVPALAAGLIGRIDTTSETSLTFEMANNKLVIPYAAIKSYGFCTTICKSAHSTRLSGKRRIRSWWLPNAVPLAADSSCLDNRGRGGAEL